MANLRSARPRLQQHSLMKRKSAAESAFFSPRFLVGFILCLIGAVLALFGFGLLSGGSASAQGPNQNQASRGVEVGACIVTTSRLRCVMCRRGVLLAQSRS